MIDNYFIIDLKQSKLPLQTFGVNLAKSIKTVNYLLPYPAKNKSTPECFV